MFDFVGILVLLVIALVFGFLATRAWKAKNGLIKWGGVIITGLLTLIPTLLLVLVLVGFSKLNQTYSNPVADLKVAGTPQQIARGQQLAHICISCHSSNGDLPLAGANFVTPDFPPIGTLYAPNLTPAGEIGTWTDGEILRAFREGIHKSGRSLLIMPAENFKYMSDEDAQALVAYLRSQPATGTASPATQFNTLGALFINLADFRTAQQPVGSVPSPTVGTADDGKYMVDIIGCRSCHGEQLQGRSPNDQAGPPPGPNLTTVIPQWSEDEFLTFFNSGKLPSGSSVGEEMPWQSVRAATTDAELKDMYTYLHGLSVVQGPAN